MMESENEKSTAAGCDPKPRRYYQNPYINYYVRLFDQKEFKGKPVGEVAKYAGQSWRTMQEKEKQEYRDMTKLATKRRKRTRGMKKSKMIRKGPKIQTALGIKQEQSDENNNRETAGTEQGHRDDMNTTKTAGTESQATLNEPATCTNVESDSSSDAFVDNNEAPTASETCDTIEDGTGTMCQSDSEDNDLECQEFCPRPPTPMPSECSRRVCMTPSPPREKIGRKAESPPHTLTPSQRVKRSRRGESPPATFKQSKTLERTTHDTSPTGISTPKRTRKTDIYDQSTLKKTPKNKKTEGQGKDKEREKKKSVKRKLSFSSDSESVYSFEPRSKRKRITKTYQQDDDECPQKRNNNKRTYAKPKARKQGDKSNMKTNKQGDKSNVNRHKPGRWSLDSSDGTATDSE